GLYKHGAHPRGFGKDIKRYAGVVIAAEDRDLGICRRLRDRQFKGKGILLRGQVPGAGRFNSEFFTGMLKKEWKLRYACRLPAYQPACILAGLVVHYKYLTSKQGNAPEALVLYTRGYKAYVEIVPWTHEIAPKLCYNSVMALNNPLIDIRRIENEDSDWKRQFAVFYADYSPPRHTLKCPRVYFAAYNGRELVGHSMIYQDAGKWVMESLRVTAEFRQQGIASALTLARIRYAIETGAKEVWYSCHDDNLVTICCHLRFGFKKVCSAPHHCAPGHWYRLKVTKTAVKKFNL
ncbi:MAG: GNAT family N-acetyltransferase, partial [Elusimicrobia bacterium]|nr:GNAT family N-acetyltransferase [Elusimicrobiota bacterium]